MKRGTVENEIKIRVEDAAAAKRRVEAVGFTVNRERVFESNEMYDTRDGRLRAAGSVLRLREAGGACTLTWKGPRLEGSHRAREEREVRISDCDQMKFILNVTGFERFFRYEKYRTEFTRDGTQLTVVVDETPIGVYMELEGEPELVDHVASELGFQKGSYITKSYGALYYESCIARGATPQNMVFD